MPETPWTPERILKTGNGYWESCALHAGVRLGVFDALDRRALSGEEAADRLNVTRRGLVPLLNALAAMGLLVKEGGRFSVAAEVRPFLVRGSESYLGDILLHHHFLMESWARLPEAVTTGRPTRDGSARAVDPLRQESFLMGMFNLAMRLAPKVVEAVDLSGRARLLDVGGGPGTYAIQFCLKNPGLSAVVLDLPGTRPFMERTAARFGVSDRVTFAEGDFTAGEFPGGFDAAWLSQILHQEGPDTCRALVARAARALAPGGVLLVHEFLLEDTMDRPLPPALFALNMLVGTDEGRAYSEGEVASMMAGAGLADVRRLPFTHPGGSGILAGTREG